MTPSEQEARRQLVNACIHRSKIRKIRAEIHIMIAIKEGYSQHGMYKQLVQWFEDGDAGIRRGLDEAK